MIDRLIHVLQQAGLIVGDAELDSPIAAELRLNGEDLADILWLALKITAAGEEAVDEEAVDEEADGPSPRVVTEIVEPESMAPPPSVGAYLPQPSSTTTANPSTAEAPAPGLPIQVRAAPALQDARSLARSLRPLRRKALSRTQQILDEQATVDRIAERDVWVPVLRPAPERWLDLELVIESSRFSFIWQETLAEFQQILERGVFRQVRTWRVEGVDEGKLHLVPKQQALTAQTGHSPRELIDAAGRRLVLYVSDCRSPVWQQGKIHNWLKLWSQHGPTAIVQLLPERLWSQTELDVGVPVQVRAIVPGAPNPKLIVQHSLISEDIDPDQALTLPIMTLTARSLQQLARVVAAVGGQRAPARLFDLGWVNDPERDRDAAVIHPQTAAERVELFLATASPIAQRLAHMMAAVPVSLPVVHLIQKQLLKESNPVHVAEVYSSSLLHVVPDDGLEPSSPDASVRYDFFAEVRQRLNERTPIDETLHVLQELSQEIARTLELPYIKSFTALLSPRSDWPPTAQAAILPFAQVATQVLYNLGGDFASFAESIEREATQKPNWLQPLEKSAPFPDLEILEFTTAQLVDPDPDVAQLQTESQSQPQELAEMALNREAEPPEPDPERGIEWRPFEFEVANLFRRGEQPGEWVIRKQRRQRVGLWREPLGNGVQLEMVSIPAGTFLMGSPENEPERYAREGPQHEVRVGEFMMGRYPVTQAQWQAVAALPQMNRELNPDPSRFKGANRPVERVSWLEAVEFCDRLSTHTHRTYRLPTEAEWEYACRAGTTTPFSFGKTLTTGVANYDGNHTYNGGPKGEYRQETTPVDHFTIANAFGLSDMHGNVWEWCQDQWHDTYQGAPIDGSAWIIDNDNNSHSRLLRGGSWSFNPRHCRSASRINDSPDSRNSTFGFRVVCRAPRTL